ncbi:uncharacterized protein LOC123270698 [Cotesia glomerata]|uniref:uncharacterized protein LOC123270698 n=1 Tax=Cotesia glomerata TaxID=32391 RepID=UPI001D0174CA|nr:uncharacterized protein LOC123270698 [Cotesia glomerata]
MKFEIFTLCVITQVFIATTFAEDRVEATVDLVQINPEVTYLVEEAMKKFKTSFSEGVLSENLFYPTQQYYNDIWIKYAKVKIINGERQYEIKTKLFRYGPERKIYAHAECSITVKTNTLDPYEVDCYISTRNGCFVYYDTRQPHIYKTCNLQLIRTLKKN